MLKKHYRKFSLACLFMSRIQSCYYYEYSLLENSSDIPAIDLNAMAAQQYFFSRIRRYPFSRFCRQICRFIYIFSQFWYQIISSSIQQCCPSRPPVPATSGLESYWMANRSFVRDEGMGCRQKLNQAFSCILIDRTACVTGSYILLLTIFPTGFFSMTLPLQSQTVYEQQALKAFSCNSLINWPQPSARVYLAMVGEMYVGLMEKRKEKSLMFLGFSPNLFYKKLSLILLVIATILSLKSGPIFRNRRSLSGVTIVSFHMRTLQEPPKPIKIILALFCYALISVISMQEQGFKSMLARLKQDFHGKLITLRRRLLSIEDVAQLLHKYLNGDPLAIRQTLLRSSAKQEVSWDDLLEFLQEELSVVQAVKRQEYSPPSATEIIQQHTNDFGKLISYVKTKETNSIQDIQHLPQEVAGARLIVICFEKQLVFYDCNHHGIINSLAFKYMHARAKLLDKEEQRKLQKIQNSVKIDFEDSDQIHEIINISKNRANRRGNSEKPGNFLTNNIKNSVRGSELSSEKSNDKMLFRRNTQSLQRRKPKANVTRIKNDDVQRVFHFFQHSSIENSIHIAHAFVDARNNFQKHIVLQNSLLQSDPKERNFQLSSAKFHKNYQREISHMRKTNKHLSSVRVDITQQGSKRYDTEPILPKESIYDRQLGKGRKEMPSDPLQMGHKQLGIIAFCPFEQYLLISLFNREVRLFRLKKTLNRINQQLVFEKCFKEVVTFAQVYRSKNKQLARIVLGLQRETQSQVIVYHLDEAMMIKEKAFERDFAFSAKYQSVLPFGVVLFNELGHFALVQLNSSLDSVEEKSYVCTQLLNPQTNYRISLSQVRINTKQTSLFLSCSSGYVYLYDRYTKAIKYQTRICQAPILDLCLFHNDQDLLVLYGNGNMAILSTFHMEKVYLYQSYGDISNQSRIFNGFEDNFYIYTSRSITPYCLTENQEKKFNNIKSAKVLKSRLKLKSKQKKAIEKSRVLKVVQGRGGQQDFLSIILQNGQILIFDSNMEYVGSYFYFKVLHITEIYTNKCHQFLAILLDNNSIQVVNLYTQSLVFTVKPETDPALKANNRPDSSMHASITSYKPRPQRIGSVSLVNFMDSEISNCFLSVISKAGKVTHYSENGMLVASINLQERLGDIPQGVMVYDEEELLMASQGSLVIMYRKSYNRKCMVRVGKAPVIRIKKCRWKQFSLCVMDAQENILLVDTHMKQVKCIHEGSRYNRNQHIIFNPSIIFRGNDAEATILRVQKDDKILLEVDGEKYFYSMIGQNIIQVNKSNGKLRRYCFERQAFTDFLY